MPRRRAERWLVAVVVLALHLVLLWAWRQAAAPPAREQPAAVNPHGVLVLLPMPREPTPRSAEPRAVTTAPTRPAAATTRSVAPAPPNASQPQAITVPLTAAAPPEPASSAAAPPLELALPRNPAEPTQRSLHEQMRNDPRANSPRATVESRVAAVSGTTAMTEERMDDTKARFRRNGHCIEVHVARNAQIDPWNQNHAPTPKVVKPSC